MSIILLSQKTISRISAGEIIESPGNVVKELVENSIDANSKSIEVKVDGGGCNLISVVDDGDGIAKDYMKLAFMRHATSKLLDNELIKIYYLGFRGEALASIAAVSRVKMSSKIDNCSAWSLSYEGGEIIKDLSVCAMSKGTSIEVRDLFFATPNRLKFLRSIKYENNKIINIINNLAMVNPSIAFSLNINGKIIFKYLKQSSLLVRLTEINKNFLEGSKIYLKIDDIQIDGYACKPTANYMNSSMIYIFVNNRPVRDNILIGAIRYAYHDFIPQNRYPILMINLTIPCDQVDVNVHPNKSEVRFQNKKTIYDITVKSLLRTLEKRVLFVNTSLADKLPDPFEKIFQKHPVNLQENICKTEDRYFDYKNNNIQTDVLIKKESHVELEDEKKKILLNHSPLSSFYKRNYEVKDYDFKNKNDGYNIENDNNITKQNHLKLEDKQNEFKNDSLGFHLGTAKCQLYNTYIVSETKDHMVIVDQHAAHERILYEAFKKNLVISKQCLLEPESIVFDNESYIEVLREYKDQILDMGFEVIFISDKELLINKIPSILGHTDIKSIIEEIVERLLDIKDILPIEERINQILSKMACYFSLRAGRKMKIEEMNALLKEIEQTPFAEQCNHGRPTYIKIKLTTIEKLFERQ